jgi:hypothetical protein
MKRDQIELVNATDNGATTTGKSMVVMDDTTKKLEIADVPSGGGSISCYQPTYNVAGSSGGQALSGTCYASLVVAQHDIDVASMEIFVTNASASTCYAGIYSEDGTTLHCEAAISTSSTGLQSATIVGGGTFSITCGTAYWFAYLEGAGAANMARRASAGLDTLTKSGFVSATPTGLPASIAGFSASTIDGYIAAKS